MAALENQTQDYEPRVTTVVNWNPGTSASAELSADSGQLRTAASLCERILTDDRAAGVLSQRATISRLPLTFEGGSKEAVNLLEKDDEFWRIVPSVQLQQLHKWYAIFGIAQGRLKWVDDDGKPRMRNGMHLPVVDAWSSARHLDRDITYRVWRSNVGDSGARVIVTPGEDGWLLWTAASDRPWAMGAYPAARVWWLLKQYAVQDWARYSERQGQGILTINGPDKYVETIAQRRKLSREIKTMGSNGVLVFPPGEFSANMVESEARTWQTFEKQIDAANAGIAIAILGQNLTSEVKSGAYASAQVHEQVASTIIATDAEAMSEFVHDQILVPWSIANFGTPDAAPWPVWDTMPREDASPRIENWGKLGDAIAKFRAEGVPADVLAMAEQAGVPLLPGKQVEAPETSDDDDTDMDDGSDGQADPEEGDDSSSPDAQGRRPAVHAGCSCGTLRPRAAATKAGEKAGQDYVDRVADSMQFAMASDLAPHLHRMVEIVAKHGTDYNAARVAIEEYYGDDMDPTAVSALVKAGLTLCQVSGWAAVRVDAPELE